MIVLYYIFILLLLTGKGKKTLFKLTQTFPHKNYVDIPRNKLRETKIFSQMFGGH